MTLCFVLCRFYFGVLTFYFRILSFLFMCSVYDVVHANWHRLDIGQKTKL